MTIDHAAWLEERRKGIGGSDAPVCVLGEYYGRTWQDLYLDKLGLAPPQEPTPDMRRGTRLEPVAADYFQEKTGLKVRRVNRVLRHKDWPFVLANIDREIVGQNAILEIKCPRAMTFRRILDKGIPEGWQIQGQHYMTVRNRKTVVFAVYCAEIDELMTVPVERDDSLIDLILDKERNFWQYVEAGELPPAPEPKALDLPPVGATEIITRDDAEWAAAVERLREAKTIKIEAEEWEKACKAEVQRLMGDAQVIEGAGARVYWKTQAGRKTLDKKALQAAHPEIDLQRFMKTGKPFRAFRPYFLKENTYE